MLLFVLSSLFSCRLVLVTSITLCNRGYRFVRINMSFMSIYIRPIQHKTWPHLQQSKYTWLGWRRFDIHFHMFSSKEICLTIYKFAFFSNSLGSSFYSCFFIQHFIYANWNGPKFIFICSEQLWLFVLNYI